MFNLLHSNKQIGGSQANETHQRSNLSLSTHSHDAGMFPSSHLFELELRVRSAHLMSPRNQKMDQLLSGRFWPARAISSRNL